MKRPVIVLKTIIFTIEGQEKLEHELLEIVRRQYDTGVIVLPNWAEYAGVFEEDTDQGFCVKFDRDHIDPECWDLIQRIKAGECLPKLHPRDGGGCEGLFEERKG